MDQLICKIKKIMNQDHKKIITILVLHDVTFHLIPKSLKIMIWNQKIT